MTKSDRQTEWFIKRAKRSTKTCTTTPQLAICMLTEVYVHKMYTKQLQTKANNHHIHAEPLTAGWSGTTDQEKQECRENPTRASGVGTHSTMGG